jgi:hypothetical protein
VIRWGFEQQGLYQPPGAPTPVTTPGAPPEVDVHVADNRNGEYAPYSADFTNTIGVWNRRSADGGTAHQEPQFGASNFLYVRVRNRGTAQADNVGIRAFQANPALGSTWPDDWQPMGGPVAVAGSIPSGGDVVAGPIDWRPEVVGSVQVLVAVTADGDIANTETATGSTHPSRLVPFDNNLALREMTAGPSR